MSRIRGIRLAPEEFSALHRALFDTHSAADRQAALDLESPHHAFELFRQGRQVLHAEL